MEVIQKLFQYRGAAPPEAMPVRLLRSLSLDLAERFSGEHFPNFTHPTGSRKHTSKKLWCAWKRMREVLHSTDAVTVTFYFV
jgi:hypothetical protein